MPSPHRLSSLSDWSHQVLADVLRPGHLAVDLTAGNGHDTRFLSERVGQSGLVLGFDVQPQALDNTAARLDTFGIATIRHQGRQPPEVASGVVLIADGHEAVADYLPRPAQAFIANLGFLPGGDRSIKTDPDTTVKAVTSALSNLAPLGRLALVIYVGHPGGREEGAALESLLSKLPPDGWDVARFQPLNRRLSPYLLVVEKL
jgi:predicted methyltransferase